MYDNNSSSCDKLTVIHNIFQLSYYMEQNHSCRHAQLANTHIYETLTLITVLKRAPP
jgi:hypothetical protein